MLRIGLDYGLYNLVYRDGNPHESPDYNFVWTRVFSKSTDLLGMLGYGFPDMPRLKRMFDAPLDFITIGDHTPALGDTTTRYAPVVGRDAATFRRGLKLFGDPRYAAFLSNIDAAGPDGFSTYEALFTDPLPATALRSDGRVVPPQPSRAFSGYGYALLNNPSDTRSIGIFYGLHVAHYHHDRLSFDLFAHGQAMTPSLGYPDGANEFNSGIFTWSKASISHNTVTVDACQQLSNPAGRLLLFADGPFARALVADAPGTYPQAGTYRRTLVMVDAPGGIGGKDEGYVVDFFDVAGGREHDYSLHGPTGSFRALGGIWSAPEPGTLAGPNVALGELYDDPVRAEKGFKGSYLDYAGSGFQHLTGVQRLTAGADGFVAEYVHDRDPGARIRLRVLPQPGQELILADARVSPLKFPDRVKYLIARRVAPAGGPELDSRFVSVLEPFAATPFVTAVGRADDRAGSVITVTRAGGERDVVIHHPAEGRAWSSGTADAVSTDAEVAVVTFDPGRRPLRAFLAGGTYLRSPGVLLTAVPLEGTVTAVDVPGDRLRVRLPAGAKVPDLGLLPGRVLELSNPLRQTVETITSARPDGDQIWISLKDDLRVGLVHVHALAGTSLATAGLRIFGSYRGVTVCNRSDQPLGTVATAAADELTLTAPPGRRISAGDDVWLIDAAVGETVRLPGVASWHAGQP
jgi:hypothetical protein